VVAGTGPASQRLKVRLYDCDRVTFDCLWRVTRTVTVRSNGTWRRDFSSLYDARGYDEARVTYEAPAGHTHTIIRTFPWMSAIIGEGQDRVFGEVNPAQVSTFRLRSAPGGAILASRTRTGSSSGDYSLRFGEAIEPGHQVTGTFADDAKLNVWSVVITITYKDGDQFISGTCLPGRPVRFDWQDGRAVAQADSQGRAFVNLSNEEQEGYRLFEGANLQVLCQNTKGDIVVGTLEYELVPEP
jgi:hypothetical protein